MTCDMSHSHPHCAINTTVNLPLLSRGNPSTASCCSPPHPPRHLPRLVSGQTCERFLTMSGMESRIPEGAFHHFNILRADMGLLSEDVLKLALSTRRTTNLPFPLLSIPDSKHHQTALTRLSPSASGDTCTMGRRVVGGAYNITTCTPSFSYLTRQRTGLPLGGINVVVKLKYKDEFN